MRNYDCVSCPFSKQIKRTTKPILLCSRGRYKDAPNGGHPIAWIKKCEYNEEVKQNGKDRN